MHLLVLPLLAMLWSEISLCADSAAGMPVELRVFIDGELKAGRKRIVVPPGKYRVAPKQSVHLSFKDLTNVVIVAKGVEMICTETARAVQFENCRDVRFEGMTVDYDPLPFTEGRITALASDKSWVEFEIITGYPENKLEERIEIYDPATGGLRREMTGWEKEFQPLGGHRYRIAKGKGYSYREKWDTEQVGDILVTNQRSPAGTGDHAIVALHCAGLRIENVTLYASPCFGFLEHLCDGTTYYRCKIGRRAPADDLMKRDLRRLRSLNADAFHSIEASKGPAIIECAAGFQGDDCVNIHGTYHLVTASHENQLRVLVPASGRLTIEPGDPVEFLPYQGRRPADAVAVKAEPDGPLTDAERAFIVRLQMDASLHERLLSTQACVFRLTLDRAVRLEMGSGVCSGKRVGNGCVVRGCDFGPNRSRGIIIKASQARIVDNKITGAWMTAILVAPEFFWWHEAACSSDVVIENNSITGCRAPAIEAVAMGGDGKPLPGGAHRNITISGNTIAQSVWPNIHATSTDGLVIRNNRVGPADQGEFAPPLPERWNWGTNSPAAMVVELCDRPVVQEMPAARALRRAAARRAISPFKNEKRTGVVRRRCADCLNFSNQLSRISESGLDVYCPARTVRNPRLPALKDGESVPRAPQRA